MFICLDMPDFCLPLAALLDEAAVVKHVDVECIMFTSGCREDILIELQILTTRAPRASQKRIKWW